MMVSLFETYQILIEDNKKYVVDLATSVERFKTKPQGIIIQDSYNNPLFPIQPMPKLDTSKFELGEVYTRFHELYEMHNSLYLPWHFCVEMIGNRYYIFNTRPLDITFPLTNTELSKVNNKDTNIQNFLNTNIFDISNAIHVCIVGDSFADVYTTKIYEIIGRTCILPILLQHRIPYVDQNIVVFNMGSRFMFDYVRNFIRK